MQLGEDVQLVIKTPLPAGTSEQAVIDRLHDHDGYIRTTCPHLVSRKPLSPRPAPGVPGPAAYMITDRRAVGRTKFALTLDNVAAGVDAVVEGRAPTGSLVVRSCWRVRDGSLEERVLIEGNLVTRRLVKGNVEREHAEYHRNFIAEAASGQNEELV